MMTGIDDGRIVIPNYKLQVRREEPSACADR